MADVSTKSLFDLETEVIRRSNLGLRTFCAVHFAKSIRELMDVNMEVVEN